MTKLLILCGLAFILLWTPCRALPAASLDGAIYYVALTGDDNNPGTIAYPWQTIQKAANTLTAGDTVYIRAGTYHEQVVPQNSGSAGQPITYAAYPGETATIDGSSITLQDDLDGLFNVADKSYIVVSGLRVINAGPYGNNAGVMVLNSGYITVKNNTTYNTNSSGIGVWGSNHIVVDGNRVEEAGGGGWQECITVASTDTFEVSNNEVLACYKEGIDAKDGSANGQIYRNHVHHIQEVGIYVDAWDKHTYNIAVYQNVVHDVSAMGFTLASEMGGLLENVRVYNNIAYNNQHVGIWVSGCCLEATSPHRMVNIHIINNTLYDNGWDPWGGGIGLENPDMESGIVRNNIVSQNLYFQIAVDPAVPLQNVSIDHNLIDGFRGTEGEIYGDDAVAGDPLFVNPASANFHLRQGSPAIDAGSSLDAPADDFDGRARPLDGNGNGTAFYDIGAYEAWQPVAWIYLPLVMMNRFTR